MTDESRWMPIDTAAENAPYTLLNGTKHYGPVLVYGPTWGGGWESPYDGGDKWTGDPEMVIASSYEGQGFWTIRGTGPSDYDDWIKPTHWQHLPDPPG